jgi:hypothetical protein
LTSRVRIVIFVVMRRADPGADRLLFRRPRDQMAGLETLAVFNINTNIGRLPARVGELPRCRVGRAA